MLGPALSWPRVPEDRVTPGRSLAALTAPIPPAVLEAKVTPRGGGGSPSADGAPAVGTPSRLRAGTAPRTPPRSV